MSTPPSSPKKFSNAISIPISDTIIVTTNYVGLGKHFAAKYIGLSFKYVCDQKLRQHKNPGQI